MWWVKLLWGEKSEVKLVLAQRNLFEKLQNNNVEDSGPYLRSTWELSSWKSLVTNDLLVDFNLLFFRVDNDDDDSVNPVWCFLENVRDPSNPASGCYVDTTWSVFISHKIIKSFKQSNPIIDLFFKPRKSIPIRRIYN